MDEKLLLKWMSCLGLNIFDNFQIMYTHPLFGKLKTFNLDESNMNQIITLAKKKKI